MNISDLPELIEHIRYCNVDPEKIRTELMQLWSETKDPSIIDAFVWLAISYSHQGDYGLLELSRIYRNYQSEVLGNRIIQIFIDVVYGKYGFSTTDNKGFDCEFDWSRIEEIAILHLAQKYRISLDREDSGFLLFCCFVFEKMSNSIENYYDGHEFTENEIQTMFTQGIESVREEWTPCHDDDDDDIE